MIINELIKELISPITATIASYVKDEYHALQYEDNMIKAKERTMCLDILTFDRCRSLYDWLPMIEYYGDGLSVLERQMITRMCIDAIKKHTI